MTIAGLYLLALCDVALVGFRVAAGRNALIEKRGYYRREVLKGLAVGHVPIVLAAIAAALTLVRAQVPSLAYAELEYAAGRMLLVFGSYATLTLVAFVGYFSRSLDLRCFSLVTVLGPLTLVRPLVIVGAAVWATASRPTTHVLVCTGAAVIPMLLLEPIRNRRARYRAI